MALNYFNTLYTNLPITQEQDQAAYDAVNFTLTLIINRIYENPEEKERSSVNKLLSKENRSFGKSPQADVEAFIRQKKLKDVQRMKNELEERLMRMQDNMQTLIDPIPKQRRRPNLQREKIRHDYYAFEKEKTDQTSTQVKELAKQQKERLKRERMKIKELQQKLEEEEAKQKAIEEQEAKRRRDEEKKERLQRLQEEAQRRADQLNQQKQLSVNAVKKNKPLYIQKQKEFERRQKQEEEKLKQLISKKREEQMVDYEEIKEHAIKVAEDRKAKMYKGEKKREVTDLEAQLAMFAGGGSAVTKAAMREKKQRLEKEQQAQERLKFIEKRARYAELVKDMFAPSIDRVKQKELELRVEKLKNPVVRIHRSVPRAGMEEIMSSVMSDGEIKST